MMMWKTIVVCPHHHVLLTPICLHLPLVTRKRDSQRMFRRACTQADEKRSLFQIIVETKPSNILNRNFYKLLYKILTKISLILMKVFVNVVMATA